MRSYWSTSQVGSNCLLKWNIFKTRLAGERTGFVQVGPEGYFFPYKYKAHAAQYYNFEARPDDIWIATVPRSGTTWTQELIWLLANRLDFEQAQQRPLTERFPFLE